MFFTLERGYGSIWILLIPRSPSKVLSRVRFVGSIKSIINDRARVTNTSFRFCSRVCDLARKPELHQTHLNVRPMPPVMPLRHHQIAQLSILVEKHNPSRFLLNRLGEEVPPTEKMQGSLA